ncbi:MAG TPA: 2-oxo acid dehydrogenase subunit E2, partial [Eubacteriaceae bacterium]|nr:2-oxo acid dehydrogenase subunit E2 [Eubacteriaceae bacterium]
GEAEAAFQTTDRPERSAEAAYETVPFNRVRKIISDNMVHSLQSTAQLTLNSSFDATQLLDYRKKLKATEDAQMVSISINDMILFAVSKALQEEPTLNSHIVDDELRIFKQVNLGFACDTDKGLMVPTIEASNKKTLMEVSAEAKELVKDCQSGKIDPSKLQGATFTVTNLGSLQIESFTPIINPPQSAILGVGSIEYKIKKEEKEYRYYPAMSLSMTIDHRGIDGAPGARFMKHLIKQLEQFELLLAK